MKQYKTMKEVLIDNNLCLSANPKGTDKGSYKSYVDEFYDKEFSKYREREINIMEIGFRHGASLALWAQYFTKCQILGLDNHSDLAVNEESPIVAEWVSQSNIKTKIGDAYDKSFSNAIEQKFDIIIDDGPHWIWTQQKAIELYLPKLKEDGLFIVEDILRGGLAILPLLKSVPLGFNAYFYYFGKSPDDCLFVVKKNSDYFSWIPNRIGLIFLSFKYIFPWLKTKLFGQV